MPPGGADRSSHTGFETPMMVPVLFTTWVRTKQDVLVSTALVACPPENDAAGIDATTDVPGFGLPVPA